MKKAIFFCMVMLTSFSLLGMYDSEKSPLVCLQARLRTLHCMPEPTPEQQAEIRRLSEVVARYNQEKNLTELSKILPQNQDK